MTKCGLSKEWSNIKKITNAIYLIKTEKSHTCQFCFHLFWNFRLFLHEYILGNGLSRTWIVCLLVHSCVRELHSVDAEAPSRDAQRARGRHTPHARRPPRFTTCVVSPPGFRDLPPTAPLNSSATTLWDPLPRARFRSFSSPSATLCIS